jgi:DNA-binding transcriptional regulator YiaG
MKAKDIQALRAKLVLTQSALAAKCGVSTRTVQGWEQGKPPSGSAKIILSVLAHEWCASRTQS